MNTPFCNITIIPTYLKYGITKDGKVYSRCYGDWRKLRPHLDRQGYVYFTVRPESNKPKKVKLHRLLLMTFDRLPITGEICRHLDGDKTNNNISNLKWGTHVENTHDAFYIHKSRVGKRNELHWNSRLSDLQIKTIRAKYNLGSYTKVELGKEYGVSDSYVNRIINNKVRLFT